MASEELKRIVKDTVDGYSKELADISAGIWNNPELCYNEHKAHALLTGFFQKIGFSVKEKYPLETAFVATFGEPTANGIRIGVCVEYDALPDVNHACGHNLIAESSVAAALALQAVIKKTGSHQVVAFGTPAEEGGGGKVKMIEAGVFNDVDICLMAHPAPIELGDSIWLARESLNLVFHGKSAHAAAAPWEGVNALDAAVACYSSVSMLRQQMKPDARVHCIIKDGGEKPNIIPRRAELNYYIRSESNDDVKDLVQKITNCAQGAALSTGCTLETSVPDPFYAAVFQNQTLMKLFVDNQKSLGVEYNEDHLKHMFKASTDMGNVFIVKPSIHPLFKIATKGVNHTPEFNTAAIQPENQPATLNAGKSLAMAVVDVITTPGLLEKIREEFKQGP